ncbi:MFS transporter [Thalassospira tepidiphila]|uniref:Membrane protein n=2 Tax=Thalassospira tepidiphila TaxID=393657 RepID=A0A853L081_9PROT|nr:MFS transporter [Thalassospira tepidiphila]NJB74682.1 MFS family permease [Thalassospira tepidiphila]OAZ10098.1 membrane protein [Thalassospira tepidiphila MCCC 1A03514]
MTSTLHGTPAKLPIVIGLGTGQTLAFGTTLYLPAILAEPMANELGIPPGWAFGAFSLALVVAALFGPKAGARIDQFGGRTVLAVSSLIFACGLAILGTADNLTMMCIAWCVIGVGMSMGLYESAFATLSWIYGHDARGPITGITLIAGFASTICWPITAGLEAEFDWRTACYFWAAMHIVLGLPLNLFLIPRTKGDAHTRAEHETPKAAPAQAKLSRSDIFNMPMILLAIVFAASWFTATAMAAHLPRLLQISGMDATGALIAASLVGPAQVAGRLAEFGLLKKMHPLISSRLSALTHPVGAVLLLIFGGPVGMLFTSLHGIGNGILTIAKGTLPLAIFGPVGYGARQGYIMAPSRFAQAAAPFVFGLLIDDYGQYAIFLTIALGLITFAALMMLRHRPAPGNAG